MMQPTAAEMRVCKQLLSGAETDYVAKTGRDERQISFECACSLEHKVSYPEYKFIRDCKRSVKLSRQAVDFLLYVFRVYQNLEREKSYAFCPHS